MCFYALSLCFLELLCSLPSDPSSLKQWQGYILYKTLWWITAGEKTEMVVNFIFFALPSCIFGQLDLDPSFF